MIESKSIVVSPSKEQKAIDDFQMFGWTLVSSQEVRNSTASLESDFYNLYTVTRTSNYVKLLFQRNKNIPNYDKICDLEDIYYVEMTTFNNNVVSIIPGKFIIIVILVCIIAGVGNIWGENDYSNGITYILLGIGIFVLRTLLVYIPRRKIAKKAFYKAYYALEEAKSLL